MSLAACFARSGPKASNDLLSVLATMGQTPHPVFAPRRLGQVLEEGAPSNLRPLYCGPATTASTFHQLRTQLFVPPFLKSWRCSMLSARPLPE